MKKLIIFAVVVLSVLLIYLGFRDNDVYYLSIGDGLSLGTTPYGNSDYGYSDYIKDYLEDNKLLERYVNHADPNMHTTDLLKDIRDNKQVLVDGKQKHIQNVLIKADLITLSIGSNDFLNNLNINSEFSVNDLYNTFSESVDDIEELFTVLRQYCKEKVIFIGFYDHTQNEPLNKFFNYVNTKMIDLTKQYDIQYIEIPVPFYDTLENKGRFPSKDGYKLLADTIIKKLDFVK